MLADHLFKMLMIYSVEKTDGFTSVSNKMVMYF